MNNILKLVRRELLFVCTSMKFQLIASLCFIVIFPLASPSLSFVGIIVAPYFLIYGALAFEERSKTHILLATLPVTPSEICIAKYLIGMIYTLIAIAGSILFATVGAAIMPPDTMRELFLSNKLQLCIGLIIGSCIYISCILPLLFKFGAEKARYLMVLIYAVCFAIVPLLGEAIASQVFANVLERINSIALLVIALCIYGISIVISTSICAKKEY